MRIECRGGPVDGFQDEIADISAHGLCDCLIFRAGGSGYEYVTVSGNTGRTSLYANDTAYQYSRSSEQTHDGRTFFQFAGTVMLTK